MKPFRAIASVIFMLSFAVSAIASERAFLGNKPGLPLAENPDPRVVKTLQKLRKDAERGGTVKVTVGVRVPFAPDPDLPGLKAAEQRADILAAQAALVSRFPGLDADPRRVRAFKFIPFLGLVVTPEELDRLATLPEVVFLEESHQYYPTLAESRAIIGAQNARNLGYDGTGQIVAVLDTGVDKNHPFLSGKVISEACYSDGLWLSGTRSLCPGLLDFSFASGSALPYGNGVCRSEVRPGEKIAPCDHGTHVAGIVAGESAPLAGIAPGARILAIQVFQAIDSDKVCGSTQSQDLSPCVTADDWDIVDGLERVYALRNSFPGQSIASVNMSLGGGAFSDHATCDAAGSMFRTALQNLRSANIATIVSSGNEGFRNGISSPACLTESISVGATWDRSGADNNCEHNELGASTEGSIACYSNSAPMLNLLAPGSEINASVPVSTVNASGYAVLGGTSMAAPHVAGAWALLKQKRPAMTVEEGLRALCSTGTPVLDPRNGVVTNQIRVDQALAALGGPPTMTFIGRAVDRSGNPQSGARVYFVANGQTFSTNTDSAGRFSLTFDPTSKPASIAYWITKAGFYPQAGNVAVGTCNTTVGDRTLEYLNPGTVILEIEPDVHHLGDNNFSGTENSQFQKLVAEGTSYTRQFTLSAAQKAASSATVTFLAKGIQSPDRLLVNGQLVGTIPLTATNGSYSELSLPVPMNVLVAGLNTLAIESVTEFGTDYDDFEFTNVALVLNDVAVAGTAAAPTLVSATPGNQSIAVAFLGGATGGGTLLDYTAECGGVSRRGPGSPIVVTGLANGTYYTCRVKATTTLGDSSWSNVSPAVRPLAPDDGFPPNAAMPAGWFQPVGSNAPWSVANDAASAGAYSLRSGTVTHNQRSDISYTGTFGASSLVTFDYRVSSESTYDVFEFLVDGIAQFTASGEAGWTRASRMVPAGTHTLTWRYRKDGSQSIGSDAAWIDRVVLPGTSSALLRVQRPGLGFGSVSSSPGGIACPTTCEAPFPSGTQVTLTASPTPGSRFAGWGGACTGNAPTCIVSVQSAATVVAYFDLTPDSNFPGTPTLPPGYTTPAGSAAPWQVTSGTSFGGTQSLRSGAIGHSQFSDLSYAATFAAGNVQFAFKVSSESCCDYLEFYIDGIRQARWSGEVDWSVARFAVTAGVHTLLWRYSKDGSAVAGSDAAWIDDVILPGAASFPVTVYTSGAGGGSVASNPAGISCRSGCRANFPAGSSITLQALPSAGSTFGGWNGACSGTGSCTLQVYEPAAVFATFHTTTAAYGPAILSFGGQSLGTTSPPLYATITNTTGSPVTLLSTSATAGFSASHQCPSIPVGGACSIAVTFSPAAAGLVAGSLSFTTSAGNGVIPLSGTGERSLVTHYYRSILRRAPDAPGKAFWEGEANRMQASGVNVNETWFSMAQAFYSSPEYVNFFRDDTGFVTDLYNTFFNRGPDGPGLAFWTGQIASGMPREVVLAGFMFSAEFVSFTQGIFGNTAVRKEIDTVTDFYRGLLGRLPDGGGLAFWIGQFRAAQCAGSGATAAVNAQAESISSSFATGGEYAGRGRNNAQYVGDLYNAFLRRGGDLAGVQFWVSSLSTGTLTREQVRRQFVASGEFQGRVAAIIAQGCLP